MQQLRQWLGSSTTGSSSSNGIGGSRLPLSPSGDSSPSDSSSRLLKISIQGLAGASGAAGSSTGPQAQGQVAADGDMRGRGMSSSVLGSGLGLGFGVAGNASAARGSSVKVSATWAALDKLLKPWLNLCRPLPPIAAFVLLCGTFLSVVFILVWVLSSMLSWIPSFSLLTGSRGASSVRAAFPLPELQNLVMVAGHSVYTSTDCEPFSSEKAWFLEPYQQIQGEAQTFLDHIHLGVKLAAADPQSLLLFSGGETRKTAGPRSEGQSYWFVAEGSKWFGKEDVALRALPEEYARDSLENLLFSVCRFREVTGHYPLNITVISYDFKQQRFFGAHRTAIRFPANRFRFVGTPMVPEGQEGARKGEEATLAAFKKDPYGCQGFLGEKRVKRDPFARTIPYPKACPELSAIFSFCGSHTFRGKLPWDRWGGSRKWLGGSL